MYVRVARTDVAMLRFLLEAEDNLGYLTVVDRSQAVAKLVYAPGAEADIERFLASLKGVVAVERLAIPDSAPRR